MSCKTSSNYVSDLFDYAKYLFDKYNLNEFYSVDYEVMLNESDIDSSWCKSDVKEFLIDAIPSFYFEDDEDNTMKSLVDSLMKDTK